MGALEVMLSFSIGARHRDGECRLRFWEQIVDSRRARRCSSPRLTRVSIPQVSPCTYPYTTDLSLTNQAFTPFHPYRSSLVPSLIASPILSFALCTLRGRSAFLRTVTMPRRGLPTTTASSDCGGPGPRRFNEMIESVGG